MHQRRLAIAKHSQDEELDDEFADVGCSVTPINTDVGITFVDPFVKDDPWRGHIAKVERLAALRARIAKPIVDTRRASRAHSGCLQSSFASSRLLQIYLVVRDRCYNRLTACQNYILSHKKDHLILFTRC